MRHEAEAFLKKEQYQILDTLLKSGNVEIRVVPKERLFLHGKAGSIHYPDGSRKSFIGSVNESKNAFANNYELVWQDDDSESADWVEEEFWALWKDGIPLPESIISEISRVASRREVTVEDLKPQQVPAAAMVEAPIYRGGEQLQPWQRSLSPCSWSIGRSMAKPDCFWQMRLELEKHFPWQPVLLSVYFWVMVRY